MRAALVALDADEVPEADDFAVTITAVVGPAGARGEETFQFTAVLLGG